MILNKALMVFVKLCSNFAEEIEVALKDKIISSIQLSHKFQTKNGLRSFFVGGTDFLDYEQTIYDANSINFFLKFLNAYHD